MANKLREYGDDVYNFGKSMYDSAKGLVAPDPSIDEGLMEKQQAIADYGAANNTVVPEQVSPSTEALHPMGSALYGDNPGEKRIDTSQMDKPLGVAHHEEGGALDPDKVNVVGENGPEEIVGDQVIPNEKDQATATPPPTSATGTVSKLKPFGGEAPDAATPAPPEPAQVDLQEKQARENQRAQIAQDKKTAAAKGDLVGLGMANIHEKEIDKSDPEMKAMKLAVGTPEEGGPPSTPAPTYGGTQKAMGTANQVQAKQQLDARRAELKQQMLSPDEVISGTARRQLAELDQQNPYGSQANHPGILGKIEHGLAKAGNIAGDILAPGTTALIPGTDLNRQSEENRGEAEVKEGEANRLSESTKAKNAALAVNAGIGKTPAALTYHDLLTGGDNGGPRINPNTNKPYTSLEANIASEGAGKNPEELYIQEQMAKGATREEATNKYLADQAKNKPLPKEDDRTKFVDTWYKDPKNADPSTGAPPEKNVENDSKANQAYTDVTQKTPQISGVAPTPGGGSHVFTAKPGEAVPEGAQPFNAEAKDQDKWVTYTDDKGVTHYDQNKNVPQGSEVTEVDPKTFMGDARNGTNVQESLNVIAKDVDEHPEIWDNPKARDILATSLEQVDRAAASMLVAGTGGSIPLPSGIGDMINTALQNNALDKGTARAVKDYIADYKAMKDQALVMQMEMQNGKMGKGSQQAFKSITDQIPNGSTADSVTAKRQLENLQRKQDTLMSKYPDKYGSYTKVKPYTKATPAPTAGNSSADRNQQLLQAITMPGGGHPAAIGHGPNGSRIVWSGVAGDPWVDLATGKPLK